MHRRALAFVGTPLPFIGVRLAEQVMGETDLTVPPSWIENWPLLAHQGHS
jgi:hypothetical protein